MNRVLVIGLGNPIRGDDAIGCHAAHALEKLYRDDPQVDVMAVHQLTPELADDVAQRDFVLFLDAAIGDKAGVIQQTNISAAPGKHGFSHHLSPSTLMSAAESLYGDAPAAICLTMAGRSFELGDQLSVVASKHIGRLIKRAQETIDAHRWSTRDARELQQTR